MTLLLAPLIAIVVVVGVALILRAQRGGQRELVGSVVESPRLKAQLPSILQRRGQRGFRIPTW